ncbi:MAG: phosphoribosylformylglycinamidine synthase subunit PurQ [Halobacteriota archaeon]|nr:phosphoribosylformylglycinamidine synthase subunit PurQ [Halobacteriota archaeon]
MDYKDIKVGILRIEGTNCEMETYLAFERLGAYPELVHLNQLIGEVKDAERRCVFDYQCLIIPGGFSSGDYIRAGAIFAARMKSMLRDELIEFVKEGRPVGGICNGFQVLVELGLLPAFDEMMSRYPQATLAVNDSARFECRPTLLKHENNCAFTGKIQKGKIVRMPCAHAEGKFIFSSENKEDYLKRLIENDQIVFRYVDPDGEYAGYPWNPNGSLLNIAGICNADRNVFGMMPHPERAFHPYTSPDWTRSYSFKGDGRAIFESVLEYIKNHKFK